MHLSKKWPFICPIAIAYSMVQIIKPVYLCRHNEFVGCKHRNTLSPFCPSPQKNPHFR